MEETQRRFKKRKLIPYGAIAVVGILALFFFFRSTSLKKRLNAAEEKEAKVEQQIKDYQELMRIDSMLVKGEYNTALNAYNSQFDNKDIDDVAGVQLRIDLAEQLIRMKTGQRQNPENLAKKDSLDSIQQQRMASLPFELQRYDSLSFALEKTKIQLANMRRQLRSRDTGEYLKFSNSKGSQMHYVGAVKDGKANGYGVALLNTGSRYVGEWRDNQRHGEGAFYWSDGEHYEGSYKDDQRNGLGTYYWPNGEKYVGQWKDDKRNGKGVFYSKKGEELTSGVWKNDKLVEEEGKEKKSRR